MEESSDLPPLGDMKVTKGMKQSLSRLVELLRCPLCNKGFNKPTTLASCAHSFCVACIDSYCCNAWVCPVEGCGMPMSITGGHRGSYRKINPQLSQTIDSLKLICQSLNRAPDDWWKSTSALKTLSEARDNPTTGDEDNEQKDGAGGNRSESDDEENMVDLQKVLESPQEDSESENNDSDWDK